MKYICQLSNYIELYSHQTRVSSLNIHSVSIDHPDLLPQPPIVVVIPLSPQRPPMPLNADPEQEIALVSPLEGAGDDAVAALAQLETLRDFSEVHKGFVGDDLKNK